ncbi:MAG: 30S ribosomal protein S20 [Candidatus Taylorbacteria bacterium]|nr:30S ribosomal protein S20 [Candidatus Taylorbacteria bacterium]
MPITSSAKKALRVSKRKAIFNIRRENAVEQSEKNIKKLLADKKVKEAEALVPAFQQAIDKAAKTGVIKANTASRKKARMVAAIKRVK